MRSSATVEHISECFIIPEDEAKQPIHYSPWDLAMLSLNYIQKGLLFPKPSPSQNPHFSISTFLPELRDSLSTTLTHFYPFSGRLVTRKQQDPHSYIVYLDPSIGPGAKFIHAVVDLSISEILSPIDTPLVVQSFFDHDRDVGKIKWVGAHFEPFLIWVPLLLLSGSELTRVLQYMDYIVEGQTVKITEWVNDKIDLENGSWKWVF